MVGRGGAGHGEVQRTGAWWLTCGSRAWWGGVGQGTVRCSRAHWGMVAHLCEQGMVGQGGAGHGEVQ